MNKITGNFSLIFIILSLVISSWLLVHILAIFGIFFAVAYPLWWLFAPKQTICFICRSRNDNEQCPFCKQKINKGETTSPKNITSATLNGILILFFSLISIGTVFLESKIVFKLGFPPTPKTVLFSIPAKGQYRLGEIFPLPIGISGIKVSVNTVQADLGFDPQKIEVVDVSTKDSFANIFIQKEINNEVGYIRLTGGLPNPGFSSDHGVFGTVYFKGKGAGVVKVEFLPSSMVLANDGRGTNVLKDLPTTSYLILPDRISDEEEKVQQTLLEPGVLGSYTDKAKMQFFEENKVLGTKVGQEIEKQQKFNLLGTVMGLLENIDRFILTFWGKILGK